MEEPTRTLDTKWQYDVLSALYNRFHLLLVRRVFCEMTIAFNLDSDRSDFKPFSHTCITLQFGAMPEYHMFDFRQVYD